jgi:uncharacterized protein with NRDE domain
MCTVVLGLGVLPGARWVLAANRDELRARPAERARARVTPAGHAWFGPLDLEAGGTWLGANAHGLVVAVTNRFGAARDPTRRSRGGLVVAALEATTLEAAVEAIAATPPDATNPFHLVVADARAGHLFVGDGQTRAARALGPGWHVLTERSFGALAPRDQGPSAPAAPDAPPPMRAERVRARLDALALPTQAPASWPGALHAALATHAADPFESACVHLDGFGYGTRATTIAWAGDDARAWHEAEGAACASVRVDRSAAFAAVSPARGAEAR